ncbi:uncharacterized protein LOC116609568 [Nematostella vectensis]|uniref:uncharacterized protein LOC116609568 n=1 Tax=Nematostella vectensis TaxID=45351 RepID=UPI00207755E1|nr:uncharacterized protein LOC116609568 [Nematostella vectensis]
MFSIQRKKGWNGTAVLHGNVTVSEKTEEYNYKVPNAAIILLSFLAFSLIFLAIFFLILRRMQTKLMEKLHTRERNYISLGLRSLISREARALINDGHECEEDEEEWVLNTTNEKIKQAQETPSTIARLQVSAAYSETTGRIAVNICQATQLATVLQQHGYNTLQVHVKMQPLATKFRYKTLSKPAYRAIFDEQFAFDGFRKRDLRKCWFRFRLYSFTKFGKKKIVGQVNVSVTDFEENGVWGTLWLDVTPSDEMYRLIASANELGNY